MKDYSIKAKIFTVVFLGLAAALIGAKQLLNIKPTNSLSTEVKSSELNSRQEKDTILRKYIAKDLPIRDAEFEIFFQDNSGGLVPGPSDWDITVVGYVSPGEIVNWIQDLEQSKNLITSVKLPKSLESFNSLITEETCYGKTDGPKFVCYSKRNEVIYARFLGR